MAAILLPACLADDPELDSEQSDIIGGTVISPEQSGIVALTTSIGRCSGVLLTNNSILTARHCFSTLDIITPSGIVVSMGTQSEAASFLALDPNNDDAIVGLPSPFKMGGTTTDFQRPLFPNATNTIANGTLLTCFGFGPTFNGGAFGTLATATLPVRGNDFWTLTLQHIDLGVNANMAGQSPTHGDSGGPCMITMPDGEVTVAGIVSFGYSAIDGTFTDLVSAGTMRSFVSQTVTPSSDAIVQWGTAGDIPLAMDFDGDGISDFVVWRPSSATWFVKNSVTGATFSRQQGMQGDIPLVADLDGDGRPDLVVWRPSSGMWLVTPSGGGAAFTKQWGQAGDIPVPADFDGDGKADIAVWRPSSGTWFIIGSKNNVVVTRQWGTSGDIPVAADYDGDGKADTAVWRPSNGTWFVIDSSTGNPTSTHWGQFGDTPLTGHVHCHGSVSVWRPGFGEWFVRGQSPAPFLGQPGDIPLIENFHFPGSDYVIWRNGTWFIDFDLQGC